MYLNGAQFPNQKLTEAEKIEKFGSVEKWGINSIDSILKLAGDVGYTTNNNLVRKQSLYDLAAGIVNKEDFQYITKPWGLDSYEFPATFTHYDIVTPKINLLKGEEIKRPFNWRIVATNTDGYNKADEKRKELLIQYAQSLIIQDLKTQGIDPSKLDQDKLNELITPEYIQKTIKHDYKGIEEEAAQKSMDFLIQYCDIVRKFNKGWNHALIVGEELYWTGLINGEPSLRVVNPLNFICDKSLDNDFVDEALWGREIRYLTPADVYDEFYQDLTSDDITLIEQMKGTIGQMVTTDGTMRAPINYQNSDIDNGLNYFRHNTVVFVKVYHIEWVSLRKIGILSYSDEFGSIQETTVDEYYKINKSKGETIEWLWINEVWEADKISNSIYKNIRPKQNQYRSLDNPSKHRLGYTGMIYNNLNSKQYSLLEVMVPHQYLYNIILYRLELELAKAQGKKMLFDISQIPTTQGFDVEKWMYYFNIMGVAFINPHEEGKGKLGQGKTSNFNQFQAIDLSLARVIDQYIMILDKLEDMVGEISGVSRQRQGQVSTSELVGNVERATVQSSHITEPLFYNHNEVKRRVLTNLLEDAKLAWIEGKKVHYVLDDMSREFFEIDGAKFANCEYGIFVSNSAKDQQILDTIKQLAQAALQNDKTELLDIVKIMEAESISQAKVQLETSLDKQIQREQQATQAQQQHEQELQSQLSQDKELDRALKKYEIDTKAATDIHKAEIMSFLGQKDQDINNNNIPDQLEIEKLAVKERDSERKHALKEKELLLDEKKLKSEEVLKEKEIQAKKEIARMKPRTSK